MKLILLDCNVISTIRQKLNKQKILSSRNRILRKLNRSDNTISSILSIREGQSGIKENVEQTKITTNDEAKLIANYFTKANTDSAYLLKAQDELSTVFGNNIESKWNSYVSFLNKMNDILYQPISKKIQRNYEQIIVSSALEFDIDTGHPIVMCCLSVLYGNNNSRGILKFKPKLNENDKDRNIYNALNDLIVVSRLSMIKALSKNAHKNYKIEYITFDNKLSIFINSIKVNYEKVIGDTTETNVSYTNKLFPDLDEASFIEFSKRVKSNEKV